MMLGTWLRAWTRNAVLTGQFVLTIAVGMGVATSLVTLLLTLGFQPPPYRDPDRVVAVWERPELGTGVRAISGPDLADLRDATPTVFASLGAFALPEMWLHDGRGATRIRACAIESSALRDIGMETVLGRSVRQEDEPLTRGAAAPPVWIGREFWQARYGGSSSVIGATVQISADASGRDPVRATVVGVLPRAGGIPLPFMDNGVDIWYLLPRDLASRRREAGVFFGLGRLRPGVTVVEAESALEVVTASLGQRYRFDKRKHAVVRSVVAVAQGPARQTLGLFTLGGGLVLLLGCLNLAILMGTEGRLRGREISIRMALGAGRYRLWREVAAEKCMLSSLALGVGAGVAPMLLSGMAWLVPAAGLGRPLDQPPHLNAAVLLAFAASTEIAALLWAALVVATADRGGSCLGLTGIRRTAPAVRSTFGRGGGRWRLILLAAQSGIGIVLLSAVALTVEAYTSRSTAGLGPAPRHTILLTVSPRDDVDLTRAQAAQFNRDLRSGLGHLPGAETIALVDQLPPIGLPVSFLKEGDSVNVERETTLPMSVSPTYFQALGIPILFGRGFSGAEESEAEWVAIISMDMAKRNWATPREAVGARITFSATPDKRYTVVGVAADFTGYWYQNPVPAVYVPESQSGTWSGTVIVRTSASVSTVAAFAPTALKTMPIPTTISGISTIWAGWQTTMTRPLARFAGMLVLALLAVALSVQGVYAVASATASARVHELAVRAALGASPGRLAWSVSRELALAVAMGIGAGTVGALAVGSLLARWLGQAVAWKPELSIAAILVLALAGAAGCYGPARTAMRANPTELLRQG